MRRPVLLPQVEFPVFRILPAPLTVSSREASRVGFPRSRFANEQDRLRYFQLAETTAAFFSFMGSLIIRKSRWDAIPFSEAFDGTLWAHVARIFAMTFLTEEQLKAGRDGKDDTPA